MRESLLEHLRSPGEPGVELCLEALSGSGDRVEEGVLHDGSGRWWWVAGGIPRLLPAHLFRRPDLEVKHAAVLRRLGLERPKRNGQARGGLEAATIDRFGAEWLQFRDWGHRDAPPDGADPPEHRGGLWGDTRRAFESKTFLAGRLGDRLVLDAGCGNGRFTRAALEHGASEIVSIDIGWGVEAAHERFRDDPRVHVVQASLFEIPLARVDAAFSLGVLMHTGDAARAFAAIARVVGAGGLMSVRMYHRGNWAHEIVDGAIRGVTTRLPKPAQQRVARRMARLGRWLESRERRRGKPGLRMRWYQVLRNHPTVHHNLDWWSAPVATHHTSREVVAWGGAAGLEVVRADPKPREGGYPFWEWPEALTVLFERPMAAEAGERPGAFVEEHASTAGARASHGVAA
ncbi:MAG: class I SAM-dependent methyltransferase [Phycisphaerales bacterium]|nr:class I SAM-dependent methyltransferase [Phycisphaerales bacterium]